MNTNLESPAPTPIRLTRIAKILLVLVVIGLLIGFVPRWISRHLLAAETRADAVPAVNVVSPVAAKADFGTPLPAEVQAFVQASIHARASGYLKNWLVDIGQSVTNGQVLAEIDSPELDQQLAQARAQQAQAQAALDLAKTTASRWTELLKTASVSEQETAEKTGDFAVKQADVQAAQANVQRLEALKGYDLVTAPFDGTVTARNTDIGQLIAADSGPELFRLAQTDPLRVYVRVPQPLIHAITPGQQADLAFQESPGKTFPAIVARTAGAVDPNTRTLQVELQMPNPRGEIFAGSYAQVRFHDAPTAVGTLVLSDNCLIFRAQGMQVAVVGTDNKVTLRSVKLGRDFGNTVEILDGLGATDHVIVNPPDSITDGMAVQISAPAETKPAK
jgi:RND family efflux transporter MFP subunit